MKYSNSPTREKSSLHALLTHVVVPLVVEHTKLMDLSLSVNSIRAENNLTHLFTTQDVYDKIKFLLKKHLVLDGFRKTVIKRIICSGRIQKSSNCQSISIFLSMRFQTK